MENILLTTRVALDLVTEKYTPLFAALREAGTLLRTDDALKYPERIRKLQRKLHRSREKESEAAVLILGQQEELHRKADYIEKMEAHVRTNELQIREQEETIRSIGETSRQCVTKMVQLFQPEGEVQMKARLYDQKVGQPGLEGAARMKNVVREYSDKVEAYLVEFRSLAEQMTRESSSASEPDEEETTNRGERVGSGDGLQGVFNMSAEAPQAGEIDRLMRMGSSTQEHTSRPVMDVEPIHMVRPGGVSPEEVRDLEEGMEAMGVQPDREERQEGGPGGHPDGQPGGAQVGEPTEHSGAAGGARSARRSAG